MSIPKLAINAPIKNRAWILPYYLESIRALDYPKADTALFFTDDGSTDGSTEMLRAFADRHRDEYALISITPVTPIGDNTSSRDPQNRQAVYAHLGMMRNLLRAQSAEWGAEYLLSVDSDTIFRPDLVPGLMAHGKPMVGSINFCDSHWTGKLGIYPPLLGGYINAGVFDYFGNHCAWKGYQFDELSPVDVTCGTYLIDKTVIDSPAVYEANMVDGSAGEDVGFCLHLARLNIPRFIDTTIRSAHVMSEGFLPEAVRAAYRLWGMRFDITDY
jgi:hypothetical protein